MWRNHPDVKLVEDIQAFGKMEDAEPTPEVQVEEEEGNKQQSYNIIDKTNNLCLESTTSDDEDEDGDESTQVPVMRNAFALLNDDD